MENKSIKSFGELMKKRTIKKPPTYQWQELALKVIGDLNVPANKKSSVFMSCKKFSRQEIELAMNDTKELCKTGEKWRYFFKIVGKKNT